MEADSIIESGQNNAFMTDKHCKLYSNKMPQNATAHQSMHCLPGTNESSLTDIYNVI